MTRTTATNNRLGQRATPDVGESTFGGGTSQFRTEEQQQRLLLRSREVADMLDRLDGQLNVDRERAVALLAEYNGLLETVVEDIRCIRDIDEDFGGGQGAAQVAGLARLLERGIAYLLGIFSVVGSGEVLPVYNWKLVHGDVQQVLGTSQDLIRLLEPPVVKSSD